MSLSGTLKACMGPSSMVHGPAWKRNTNLNQTTPQCTPHFHSHLPSPNDSPNRHQNWFQITRQSFIIQLLPAFSLHHMHFLRSTYRQLHRAAPTTGLTAPPSPSKQHNMPDPQEWVSKWHIASPLHMAWTRAIIPWSLLRLSCCCQESQSLYIFFLVLNEIWV